MIASDESMNKSAQQVDQDIISDKIDKEIAEFVRLLQEDSSRYPDRESAPLVRQREIAHEVRKRWSAGGPDMARREELHFHGPSGRIGLRLLSLRKSDQALPAMIYVHGGGFTSFSIDTHDRLMREYAAGFDGIVIGVEYSLSPEAKFPVALEEVVETVDWVHANAASLGVDPNRLAIGGDSAGANLSIATCLKLRDTGYGNRIKAMILNYGFFGSDLTMDSNRRHGGDDQLLSNMELQAYIDNYLAGTPYGNDPLAWPILADLHGLPPTFNAIAECDPLADADLAMVAKLQAAGNAVMSIIYHGATHSFLEAVSISSLAQRAFADQSAWLSNTLRYDATGDGA